MEAAIRGMRDGTINPEDVKVAGIESEEEKAQAEVFNLLPYVFIIENKMARKFLSFLLLRLKAISW